MIYEIKYPSTVLQTSGQDGYNSLTNHDYVGFSIILVRLEEIQSIGSIETTGSEAYFILNMKSITGNNELRVIYKQDFLHSFNCLDPLVHIYHPYVIRLEEVRQQLIKAWSDYRETHLSG